MSDSTEYQQVAAITCLDIDTLARVAEDDKWTKEDLQKLIFRLKSQKDLAVTDANVREMRYNALQIVFSVSQNK